MINHPRFFSNLAFLVVLLCASLTQSGAQKIENNQGRKANAPLVSDVARNEPFKIGETLEYGVTWSRLRLQGLDVAEMTFKIVEDPKNAPNNILLKAEAVSKGSLLKIASIFAPGNISFVQKFDSTVQTDDFRILRTVHYDENNKRIRHSEANFDYTASKVTYRETNPNNSMSPPRMITSPLDASVQDIISAIYYLRRQPLAAGQEFTVNLSDSGVVYDVPIKVVAREQQKSVLGKFWTLRVQPQIFGEKRPLAGDGKMSIWITDDARHLPLRAQIQASIGKIEIKLRRAENLQPVK